SGREGKQTGLRFLQIEFEVAAFAFLFEDDEFVVGAGDGAAEFGARAGEVVACFVDGLALCVELRLDLVEARFLSAGAMRMRGGAMAYGWPRRRRGRFLDAGGERVDLCGVGIERGVRRGKLCSHLLILGTDLLVLGGEGLGAV